MVSNNVVGLGALKSSDRQAQNTALRHACWKRSVQYCHCCSAVTNRGRARKREIPREKEILILF